jgi:hypothetical protein
MEVVKRIMKNPRYQMMAAVAIVIIVIVVVLFMKKGTVMDMFSTGFKAFSTEAKDYMLTDEEKREYQPNEEFGHDNGGWKAVDSVDIMKPGELLPQTDVSTEVQAAVGTDAALVGDNYLAAGVLAGVNTIQSSMKNANLDIRSAPAIPKQDGVSPWMMSTIEHDSNGLQLA